MKAVIIEIDGIINTGVEFVTARREAALTALDEVGIRITPHEFNAAVELMRATLAEDPIVSGMWRLYRGVAQGQGASAQEIERRWESLLARWRGLAGYRFHLHPELRRLLEEVRFNTVDCWGEVPRLVAVGHGGAMVRNALETARLMPLFDRVFLSEETAWRPSDPRFLTSLCDELGVEAHSCFLAGVSIACFLGTARELGMFTVQVHSGVDGGMASRGPWEEPVAQAATIQDLGNLMFNWINAPVAVAARAIGTRGVRP